MDISVGETNLQVKRKKLLNINTGDLYRRFQGQNGQQPGNANIFSIPVSNMSSLDAKEQ